jgi:hypothetical protein
MPTRLRSALAPVAAGVAAAAVVCAFTAGTPAFAKSTTTLSGPGTARVGHAFQLTASVGDDGGASPAWARLQVLGAHGRYSWYGSWQRLRLTSADFESCTFVVTEWHRGPETFHAVINHEYAPSNTVTVVAR